MEIWILGINTDYGIDLRAFDSYNKALTGLHNYVVEWWGYEFDDEDIPQDNEMAIDVYFSNVEGEWYSIEKTNVR